MERRAEGLRIPAWPVRRFRTGPTLVWYLNALLLAAALLIYAGPFSILEQGPARLLIPWWVLAAAFLVAERNLVHLEFRRHAHSYSLFEIPLVAGFFFAGPVAIAAAQLLNLSASFLQRREFVKSAFNFANATFSTGVALLVFYSLADPSGPTNLRNSLAAFLATLIAAALEASMVMVAMFFATGELQAGSFRRSLGLGVLVSVTNTSLALMATTILWFDPKATALFLVPTIVLFFAYRAFVWQRRKSESLESLYESTRVLHHSVDSEPATRDLLEQARKMFRSEVAEFLLFASTENEAHVRVRLDADGELHVVKSTVLDPNEGVWARVASADQALIGRPIRERRLAELLSARGLRDAMVAPLRGETGVIGTLLVANRVGETFRPDDLPLFETLANHASVSLANARLMDRLREEAAEKEYQALHDSLTGLPNRTLFRDRLEHALATRVESSQPLAVVLIDLDRFKEINDTLGHHNGDLLLQEVAGRLRRKLHPDVTVARFSGDEFALLLPRIVSVDEAVTTGKRVLSVLAKPFALVGVDIDVSASMGIAIHPLHGDDVHKLIRRADVAMYLAKETHSGLEVYSTDRDGYSPARLALASELRQAIEHQDLIVHYQPKVDMRTNRVVGAEALVRWIHPARGFMPPDDFIPLAEHTGLIRPLTKFVLRSALRQCRRWREEGLELDVAVNLSVRSLLDLHLPETVSALLQEFRVEPTRLVLEITESSIMADPIRAADVVDRLSELGIGLAIDDFGTGYSSLSHLKSLPVSEIKIDKSFVMSMISEENDAAIVRSTVDLGRNLGLRVVAEGVETVEMWRQLELLGCDVAQGYLLSRPLPAAELSCWAATWRSSPSKALLPALAS
ncbi:MAG: putative bifunctional diguanylate cyclase/phosphodiesterase [Actinomycetota bacterium]